MIKKINDKEKYSLKRLDQFRKKVHKSETLLSQKDLCIYTTGSFGRLEACEHSDIDLFFLYDHKDKSFSRISKTLIDAHIIQINKEMNFPEFSDDGEYLEIHSIENIYNELGSRKDDYYNYFTARMLLLLESRPIYNDKLHAKIIDTTIEKYYKDFHEHELNFKPIFIVNDVIRFWRTMCLNYEHNRNRKFMNQRNMTEAELNRKKCEVHVKNIKLRFSRKLTCYSFLLSILWNEKVLSKAKVKLIAAQTPLQRLITLRDNHKEIEKEINSMIDLYFWFLEVTQIEKEELLSWIGNENNRNLVYSKSREFDKEIYKIMNNKKNEENLMYFLI